MRIRITAGGIYGANGELAIGTEFDVSEEPKGWAGRYIVIDAGPSDGADLTADSAPVAARRGRPPKGAGNDTVDAGNDSVEGGSDTIVAD